MKEKTLLKTIDILVSFIKNNHNASTVASEFGLSRERVRQILSQYGIHGAGVHGTTADMDLIRDTFVKHKGNVVATAKELKMSAWTIYGIRKRFFPDLEIPQSNRKVTDAMFREQYIKTKGNLREMAAVLSVAPSTIYNIATKLGVKGYGHQKPKVTDEQLNVLFTKHTGNVKQIARELSKSPAFIYTRLKKLGLK